MTSSGMSSMAVGDFLAIIVLVLGTLPTPARQCCKVPAIVF